MSCHNMTTMWFLVKKGAAIAKHKNYRFYFKKIETSENTSFKETSMLKSKQVK